MKTEDLTIAYGVIALLSVLLFCGYFFLNKKKNGLLLALFGCVAIVNSGYFLLAISKTITMAKFANGVSYFGAAFAVLVMLLVICDVCQIHKRSWLNGVLWGISISAFVLAASGDWKGLFYESVALENIGGMTRLIKVYGPLHDLYGLYLGGYMLIMLLVILWSAKKKKLVAPKYALLLFCVVLINIAIWAVQQRVSIDFELLSISYILSEVLLLVTYELLRDYGIISPENSIISVQALHKLYNKETEGELPTEMEDLFQNFAKKTASLSSAERRILYYYIEGYEISEIPELAYISIHTVKKHNRSIYQKLGINSRDELMLYLDLFRRCDRLDELMEDTVTIEQ